jgi:hypothetical protein
MAFIVAVVGKRDGCLMRVGGMTHEKMREEYILLKQLLMHHSGSLCPVCRKAWDEWAERDYQRILDHDTDADI